MSNLASRTLAAAIYFPILLLSVFSEGTFTFVAFLLLALSWHEYYRFRFKAESWFGKLKNLAIVLLLSMPVLLFDEPFSPAFAFALLGVGLQVIFIYFMLEGREFGDCWNSMQFILFGVLYLTGLFSALVLLQGLDGMDGGREAVWFLIFVVGATDTGAYFAGKHLGNTPFFQWISPSKTWEGVVGGCVAGVIASLIFCFVYDWFDMVTPPLWVAVILSLFVSAASIVGDLVESLLKRYHGVKDSGSILAGHGGVLDRFDGVIFAALPLYVLVVLGGGFNFVNITNLYQQ